MGNFHKLIAGYFSNPEATASTLDSNGWMKTGDLCYIDDDGFIFIVDRLKELIKYKGYQVKGTFSFFFLTHYSKWVFNFNSTVCLEIKQ